MYLVVQPSGARSWALRYRFAGKTKKLTLGPVLDGRTEAAGQDTLALGVPMTLAEARRTARIALQILAEGIDPSAALKAARVVHATQNGPDRDLVRTVGASFIERYAKPRNRSWREVQRQLDKEVYPRWGHRRVQSITKRDVLDLLNSIVDRGSPVTANRVFATVRKLFAWLVDRDVMSTSPCIGVKMPTAEQSRDRVLTDDELRLFWKASGGLGEPFGPMFRLLLVTGQRREEVAGLKRGRAPAGRP